ncbi:MAG: competence protein TfoX [Spirochaetaceae bacterium]|nr:MAG: competence protein TfoX [Spirochaetaceae bacterium]
MQLESLPNIGAVLANRLRSVGITDAESLRRLGAVEAYTRIAAEYGPHRPPLCYNLYSLEAALRGHDWRLLDDAAKRQLRELAGVEHRDRSEGERTATRSAVRRDPSG